MVDNKSKDDIAISIRPTEASNLCDTVGQNCTRIVDAFTKAQPQYTQSASNLQHDYIAAVKSAIQHIVSAHKVLVGNFFHILISVVWVCS